MAAEQDFDDVQKTISNWMYQIIDIDVINDTFDVESYSIGSAYNWKDNELMDEFHHYKGIAAPTTPTITNVFNGNDVELPLEIASSAYQTTSGQLLNSTEFMIGKTTDFEIVEKDVYRDYENLYGSLNGQVDVSKDQNEGVDITKLTLGQNEIPNGQYFVKVRHRDRNLSWSAWSEVKTFNIINSTFANTQIQLDTIAYLPNTPITVSYTDGPGNQNDWLALYKKGQTPGSSSPSQLWTYVNGQTSGTYTFAGLTQPGMYFATFLENDGYTELAERKEFYVGPLLELSADSQVYASGSPVTISYVDGPQLTSDWIGIYRVGQTPGGPASTQWTYVSAASGSHTFNNLADGYYFAEYFLQDGYGSIGNKVYFQVGEQITQIGINKTIYNLNENIIATWTDAPGIVKDWLGIYHEGDDPNVDELVSFTYFEGLTEGSTVIKEDKLPTEAGDYFIVMFTNDSYNEVSNRISFKVEEILGNDEFSSQNGVMVYPNPVKEGENTYIKSKYPIDQIDMFDLTGNLFYTSKNISDYNFSIINQSLPTGIYILKIHSNKVYTVKVIIE
jgi:hypothetical protein